MSIPRLLIVAACFVLAVQAEAQTAPKMKMTTEIPDEIETPAVVETRLGTLHFEDGIPGELY